MDTQKGQLNLDFRNAVSQHLAKINDLSERLAENSRKGYHIYNNALNAEGHDLEERMALIIEIISRNQELLLKAREEYKALEELKEKFLKARCIFDGSDYQDAKMALNTLDVARVALKDLYDSHFISRTLLENLYSPLKIRRDNVYLQALWLSL